MKKTIIILLVMIFSKNIYCQCFQNISAGYKQVAALKSDNSLWAWGNNDMGVLGNGTNSAHSTPIHIFNNCQSISFGYEHSMAIKQDGTLWTWGGNNYGQLGDGTNIGRILPTQIGSETNWMKIDTRDLYSFALKNDGTLWAWGWNFYGQFGDGTYTFQNIPTQIGTDTNWIDISGNEHTIALKTDGSLWAWGQNNFGELGNGTNTESTVPIQIGMDNNWLSISGGGTHNLAIKNDGTLWSWGQNNYGQLGDGTFINKSNPIQVGTDNDWQIISASDDYHSMAIKNNGTLWAWGHNDYGQLGDGTSLNKNIPVQIGSDTDWQNIDCGVSYSIAIKNDGSFWAWGANDIGQFGNGSHIGSFTPINIICPTLGIDGFEQRNEISIYPNPVIDKFKIENISEIKMIEIFDITGKNVIRITIISDDNINISTLKKGIYLLRIINNNDSIFIKKLIKI